MSRQEQAASNLAGIGRSLSDELRRLDERRGVLQDELKANAIETRRVRTALRALGLAGEVDRRSGRKTAALTTRDVVRFLEESLEGNAAEPAELLRQKVEARARAAGRSLIGFHLRFGKALEDQAFAVERAGERTLVRRRPPSTTESAS